MDAAQRVGRAHHRLRRRSGPIGLERLQLGVERREMLLRFVTQYAEERRRQGNVADGNLVRFRG